MRHVCRRAGVILVLFLMGCGGETRQQVIDRYKPPCQAVRQQWQQIARKLPPAGTVKQNSGKKDLMPLPVFDNSRTESNTEIVMSEQLLDPDVDLRAQGKFDVQLSGRLVTCLLWTGPKNPMSPAVLSQPSGDLCSGAVFDSVLGYSYLVVLRTVAYDPPIAIDDRTYRGGQVDLEGFLIDLKSSEVLGSFRVAARPDPAGEYVFKQGEDPKRRLEAFAHSTMTSNARKQVQQALTKITGGRFNFDR